MLVVYRILVKSYRNSYKTGRINKQHEKRMTIDAARYDVSVYTYMGRKVRTLISETPF